MASVTATVETLTAEVRVLMVGRRQVTMSVFRQLDTVGWKEWKTLELFGRVRETRKDEKKFLHVVGRVKDTGVLVRSKIDPNSWEQGDPNIKRYSGIHDSGYHPYPEALRRMRLDIAFPVRYHYDMSEPQRDEILKTVDHSRSKLENLKKAKDKAYDTHYEISWGELPELEQSTSYSSRCMSWWSHHATEEQIEERRVAEEALEKAKEELEAQEDITKDHNDWLLSTKSLEYINEGLTSLDDAVSNIETMNFGKATMAEWRKLPLIVLAGLT